MDAAVTWTSDGNNTSGILTVYLTDTVDLSHVRVRLQLAGDSSLLMDENFSQGGGLVPIDNYSLQLPLGTRESGQTYEVLLNVVRRNDEENTMVLQTNN